RGGRVDLRFTVPTANTDNSRPANLSRVDVYAVTGTAQLTDDQWVKYGIKVDSVAVKAPRDPNATIDEDEPDADMEAPEGLGLDQGAVATLSERLTSASLVPFDASKLPRVGAPPPRVSQDGPLLGPPTAPLTRTYVGVGVTTRERRGPVSRRVTVPLIPPPSP